MSGVIISTTAHHSGAAGEEKQRRKTERTVWPAAARRGPSVRASGRLASTLAREHGRRAAGEGELYGDMEIAAGCERAGGRAWPDLLRRVLMGPRDIEKILT